MDQFLKSFYEMKKNMLDENSKNFNLMNSKIIVFSNLPNLDIKV